MDSISMLKSFCDTINCHAITDEPMSRHSTFKIGGPADIFISPNDEGQIASLLTYFQTHEISYCVLGKGSNILVGDCGIRGAVLHIGHRFSGVARSGNTLKCKAGTPLAQLCYTAYREGLSGLEFAWGIPGSTGGAAYMNAGAYGGEMRDVLLSCSHIDEQGTIGSFSGQELELGYRKSVYCGKNYCITSLKVRLKPAPQDEIKACMDELLSRRKAKQPLEFGSAGSTFKRPEGHFAGALIEQCGLKGRAVGGAMVSTKHSGFVINTGDATCDDVMKLIDIIKEEVFRQTGVTLECEIRFFSCN